MAACEKHATNPVKGCCECPRCEVEHLQNRIADLEAQVAMSRQCVEAFKKGLYSVPQYGDRVNKTIRQKLAEAYSPILNLPATLDSMQLAASKRQ